MAGNTRERLLDTAELFFGERGIESSSLRDITGRAGVNAAAVHYHFGSKEGLLRAVFARRMGPMNEERIRFLDQAEPAAGDDGPTLEKILEAWFGPAVRMYRAHPPFMRFLARLHMDSGKLSASLLSRGTFAAVVERFRAALVRALPEVPAEELWWGIVFLTGAMVHTWTKWREIEALSGGEAGFESDEAMIERLTAFGAAGLRAAAMRVGGGVR